MMESHGEEGKGNPTGGSKEQRESSKGLEAHVRVMHQAGPSGDRDKDAEDRGHVGDGERRIPRGKGTDHEFGGEG